MSVTYKLDARKLLLGLTEYEAKTIAATKIFGETVAKDFESYAKANRPWTDRTGNARQGLRGYTTDIPNGVRVNIAHSVDYGIWLEYAHEKKYAILEPTVRLKGPDAIKAFRLL